MNHNVDDDAPPLAHDSNANQCLRTLATRTQHQESNINILSRIRTFKNNFATTSLGSLFSPSPALSEYACSEGHSMQILNYDIWDSPSELDSHPTTPAALGSNLASPQLSDHRNSYFTESLTPTPTPTRRASPSPHQHPFAEVKRMLSNFARSRQQQHVPIQPYGCAPISDYESYSQNLSGSMSAYEYNQQPVIYKSTSSCSGLPDDLDKTPPLTPDFPSGLGLPPSSPSYASEEAYYDYDDRYDYDYGYDSSEHESEDAAHMRDHPALDEGEDSDGSAILYTRPHSLEIKEGKKPERPICYDSLIADIGPSPSRTIDHAHRTDTDPVDAAVTPAVGDLDEWYGLEYTLELSCRERRPSDNYSVSVGEHSKSRESWALLHQGTIHPFFEDEDYYQWKNWHRYLDKQDERKRHKKGLEFRVRAKEEAWWAKEERRGWDLAHWQLQVYGTIGEDLKERLTLLVAHRPDPYYPAKKHNLGWYLKRSCSVASLRELRPVPKLETEAVSKPEPVR